MFWEGEGHTVKPFSFTNEQLDKFRFCFKGDTYQSNKMRRADKFCSELEAIIELWLDLGRSTVPARYELESDLNNLTRQCEKLAKLLEEVDKKTSNGFSTELEWHYRKNYVSLTVEDTEEAIRSIKNVSGKLSNRVKNAEKGHNKRRERELVDWIATCYSKNFGSQPGIGEESNFSKLIKQLNEIIGTKIGQPIINEIAAKHQQKNM